MKKNLLDILENVPCRRGGGLGLSYEKVADAHQKIKLLRKTNLGMAQDDFK